MLKHEVRRAPAALEAVEQRELEASALRGHDLAAQTQMLAPGGGYDAQAAALAPGQLGAAKAKLVQRGTVAAKQVLSERGADAKPDGNVQHPHLTRLGHMIGLGLGVIVTEALRFVPGWNDRLLDDEGKPVEQIEGAKRIGDHDLRKRHEEVVGPKIAEYVEKLEPGRIRDLLYGVGEGASEAPGASYRLEAHVADRLGM